MNILVIILLLVCTSCYTGQSFFNKLFTTKYDGPQQAANPIFSCIYGLTVSIVSFLLNGCSIAPSGLTIVYGMINGVVLFLYYLGMIQAARRGPYSFQSIVMLLGSIVVCIICSRIFFGDYISMLQYAGIGVMLVSFIVLNFGGLDFTGIKKGYYFWTFSLFFTNGIFGVLLDAQQRAFPEEKNDMIFITFLSCAIFSFVYLIAIQKGKIRPVLEMNKSAWTFALISSICAAFAVYLLMVLLGYIPSYILYTVNNGAILVISQLLCVTVLKEKMTKQAVFGILLAATSVVVLSF